MAAAAPYIVAAVGTALSYKANQDAAGERRNIINAQLENAQKATEKAATLVQQEAQQYGGQNRQAALTDQEERAYAQSQKDLATGAGGSLIDTAGGNGNVSTDFLKAKADKQVTEGNYMTALAREVAKTRAPSLLLTKEGQSRANLAGNLQNTFSGARDMAAASKLDIDMVEPAAYGQIAQAVGNMGSMYLSNTVPGGKGVDYSLATQNAGLGEEPGTGYFGQVALGNNAPGSSFWNPSGGQIKFKN